MSDSNLQKKIDELTDALSVKQLNFARYCIEGYSPIESINLCELSTGNQVEDLEIARELNNAPAIKLYIRLIKKHVAQKSCLSLEEIDKKLSAMASVNIMDMIDIGTKEVPIISAKGEIVASETKPEISLRPIEELTSEQRAAVKSIKVVKGELHIKNHDQQKALDMLIRRQSGYKDVSEINHSGNVNVLAITGDNGRYSEDDD